MSRTSYAEAGVDVDAAEKALELMRLRLRVMSEGSRLLSGTGEFGAVLGFPDEFRKPLMVTSTDGVGTKTDIARRLGRFDTIGQDLVAMCADDVVCHGAQPTYFLDYVAVGQVDPERVADLVAGVGQACESIGCVLVGGETAEHPGLMEADEFDLAGFCIGFVEKDQLIDAGLSQPGDTIVGMASSGLHSNGYSLVRRLLDGGQLPLTDELLTPTRLYSPAVLDLATELRRRRLRIGGLAHITGGGLARNLPRATDPVLGVRIRPSSWPQPRVFDDIARGAGVAGAEMRATFNCGVGFAAVMEPAAAGVAIEFLRERDIDAWQIGEVRPIKELGGNRYIEA